MEGCTLDDEEITSVLRGNTLKVYWFLLRAENGVVGARETQRALGFSSPALAVYHLDKLTELGLVEKIRGEYCLVKTLNVIRFGTFMLPRYFLYAYSAQELCGMKLCERGDRSHNLVFIHRSKYIF